MDQKLWEQLKYRMAIEVIAMDMGEVMIPHDEAILRASKMLFECNQQAMDVEYRMGQALIALEKIDVWTEEKPTIEGYYWMKEYQDDDDPEVVRIEKDGKFCQFGGGTYMSEVPEEGSLWLGPIKPPEEIEMDHRALLKKYMAFIMYEESIDYISKIGDVWDGSGMSLTEEEKLELITISQEIVKERQE